MFAFRTQAGAEVAGLPRHCRSCLAWEHGLCGTLTPEQLRQLAAGASRRRVPAGAEIMSGWDDADGCAILLSGVAKLSKLMADGRQQIVALKGAQDFLGRPFADDSPKETHISVRAVTELDLCSFSRPAFEAIIRQNHSLEHGLYLQALAELDEAQDLLLTLGRKTAREKVTSFLLLVAERLSKHGAEDAEGDLSPADVIELPLTRAEIADFLGLTFETVSRQLAALKRDNLIALPDARRVVVRDPKRLRAATGV